MLCFSPDPTSFHLKSDKRYSQCKQRASFHCIYVHCAGFVSESLLEVLIFPAPDGSRNV